MPYPEIGSLFIHRSGAIYRADRLVDPHTKARRSSSQNIVFVDVEDGREWRRSPSTWYIGFKPYKKDK